jgi:hypothetical protein
VKRAVTCAGLVVVAMAFPATSSARMLRFHGPGHRGGSVSFHARIRHERIRRVGVGFAWKNLPVRCTEGYTDTDGSFTRRMSVHGRRFHGTGRTQTEEGWVTARVAGRFARRGTKAHGTIRVLGDFSRGATDCDTGRDRWQAHCRRPHWHASGVIAADRSPPAGPGVRRA